MDGQDHKHFGRLAVLLLALADLAERAGSRCLPVRCLVLWILRRAETVALAYAVEATGSLLLLAACPRTGDTSDDAARLAKSLRALAAVFRALAHWARLTQDAAQRGLRRLPSLCPIADPRRLRLAPRTLDTS